MSEFPVVYEQGQVVWKQLASSKYSGMLLRALEKPDKLSRRKACHQVLADIQKAALTVRPAILDMAKKAVTRGAK